MSSNNNNGFNRYGSLSFGDHAYDPREYTYSDDFNPFSSSPTFATPTNWETFDSNDYDGQLFDHNQVTFIIHHIFLNSLHSTQSLSV